MDDLARDGTHEDTLESFELSWRDARRLGLRRVHYEGGWLQLERIGTTFRDVSWSDVERDLAISLADVVPAWGSGASTSASAAAGRGERAWISLSPRALAALGLTATMLRERGMTRERFLACPYTQREWIDYFKISRHDLAAFRLRPDDFKRLCSERGWSAISLEIELGYSVHELRKMGLTLVPEQPAKGRAGAAKNGGGFDALVLRI